MSKSPDHKKAATALAAFLDVISKLRDPERGCPWDLKQTFESLRSCLIEESYEVSDAVEKGDTAVCEELGDLLSLVALYGQIADERNAFSFASILEGITAKLIRRHPHVFGDLKVSGEAEVLRNWEAIKEQERATESKKEKGLLDGLPRSMPSLLKSHEIGVRCARVGFDWSDSGHVAEKVNEELQEFLAELPVSQNDLKNTQGATVDTSKIFEEFGDLLFTLVQEARHLGFNAEDALTAANTKFLKRFRTLESIASQETPGEPLGKRTAAELEALWQRAKKATA